MGKFGLFDYIIIGCFAAVVMFPFVDLATRLL